MAGTDPIHQFQIQKWLPLELGGYHAFWSCAQKPGYSGVAVFTREKPLDVKEGDVVIFSKYGGTEVKYNGEEFLILSARDVLAVVNK